MDIVGAHLREAARQRDRTDPVRAVHEALARPLGAAYAWLGSASPAVHLQALLVAAGAIPSIASGHYGAALGGLALLWVGHILQLAARHLDRKRGDPWAVLLEGAVGRGVDVALAAALGWLAATGLQAPSWVPGDTLAPGPAQAAALAAATAGAILLRAHLRTAGDLQVLRAHLQHARRAPGPTILASGEPHPAWTWGRERSLLLTVVLVACGQPSLALLALAAMHAAGCLATLARTRSRLQDPEPRASAILARGYDQGFP